MSGFLHMCLNSFPANVNLLVARLRDMGVSGYRVSGDPTDDDMDMIASYGDINCNVGKVPDAAAGGVPTYGGGLQVQGKGCLEFINPVNGGLGADNLRIARVPYCTNPPLNIDRAVIFAEGAKDAKRPWAAKAKWVSFGNEMDDMLWPTRPLVEREWGGNWDVAAQHGLTFFFIPYISGWLSVLPQTKVLGFDTQTCGWNASMYAAMNMNLLITSEIVKTSASAQMIRDAWLPCPFNLDVNGVHTYAMGGEFPIDALDRLNGFGGYIPYLKGRGWDGTPALASTEVDDESGQGTDQIPAYLAASWAMHQLVFVTLYNPAHYFGDGTEKGLAAQLAAKKCEPNPLYDRMQRTMQQITSRHRAVVHS
jgi:hypothetical protein